MAWIESHTVLLRHRKLREAARALRLKPVYLMGHLHALWHAALEQQEDGDLSAWSDELIAESSEYPGDAPQYVSLLQDHGWLDGKLLHDWLDYAGLYLTRKYASANRPKLMEIWQKHGRVYGSEQPVNGKQTNSKQKVSLPDLTNPPTKPKPSGEGGDGFARFWSAWPRHSRKADRTKCEKLWKSANLESRADAIVASVELFKQSRDWTKDGGQYIPAPLVWLRGERWEVPASALSGEARVDENGFERQPVTNELLEAAGLPPIIEPEAA